MFVTTSLTYIRNLLPEEDYEHTIAALVTEFLIVFPLFEENSDVKKQCIWPSLVLGEMLHLVKDRVKLLEIFDPFYDQNKMGNVRRLQDLLKKVWSQQISLNSVLEGDGWNSSGIELLPMPIDHSFFQIIYRSYSFNLIDKSNNIKISYKDQHLSNKGYFKSSRV
jgi:hypothetical protein